MAYFLQQFANGLHAGAIYALLAFGYALAHGVLRRADLSYGALFAFAGQTLILASLWAWNALWLAWWAAIIVGASIAAVATHLVSRTLAQGVFEPLRQGTLNSITAATLGVSIVLMEGSRIAADTRDLWLPPLLAVPITLIDAAFPITLTLIQLLNIAVAVVALAALTGLMARSAFGRAWRAFGDDPLASALCGIDTSRVFSGAILFAGAVATLAGALAALTFGNLAFGSGLVFGLKILFLSAAGGLASPTRSAVGAWLFGIAEALWTGYFGLEWREAWMLGFLAAILVLRAQQEQAEGPG